MRKAYGVNELREMFLKFFESKEHLRLNSFSLIPNNDRSLLLINSGMAPLKPYFTGAKTPPRKRVTTCQKCIRTGDIENVGKTARHGTFFEMLGNFSFGDYFKLEAITWTWEFLTEVCQLDPQRLYPSVYMDDDEAFDIWNKVIGIPKDRIFHFGKEDNFWEHGAGPCGPCSEVYYDRGEKYGCNSPDCTVGCDCDRYMEIWNNVFTQFDNDGEGHYTELDTKNIDTGMGLERLAVVIQEVDSIFDVDTVCALRNAVCKIAKTDYHQDEEKDVSIRVITDHIRSITFMISDGIMPSNEGRGYVLRRLIRRAFRHGRLLGIEGGFLTELSHVVIEGSKDGYPELEEKKDFISKVISQEEERFVSTIDQGLKILEGMYGQMDKEGIKVLSGKEAFKLYDTYGFPIDLTREILEEKGYTIDEASFFELMQHQRDTARNAREVMNYMGADSSVYDLLPVDATSRFVGYDCLKCESEVTYIVTDTELSDDLANGMRGTVITEKSPFYASMGGQEGDRGRICFQDGVFEVEDTVKIGDNKIGHVGFVSSGILHKGCKVFMEVDPDYRDDTCKNHSATHLLHKALKTVLGTHVEQKGSLVTNNRLRFDFAHFSAMTSDELEQVEKLVNAQIQASLPVTTDIMNIADAKKTGAVALFGEKYGDEVRVVSMGDFSKEFCGGTHVENTGKITIFKILSESGVAAGVRRIEAITGKGVFEYYNEIESNLKDLAVLLRSTPVELNDKIRHLMSEVRTLSSENESLRSRLTSDSIGDVDSQIRTAGDMKALVLKVEDLNTDDLRNLGDKMKDKIGDGVVVIICTNGDKVSLLSMATEKAVKAGAHAGSLIKEIAGIVGGRGGGRPNMAQAGGKDPSKVDEAVKRAYECILSQLA